MALQIAFHMVFSHLPGDLERFADSSGILWNPPTIFRPDLIVTAQQAIPFVSERWSVDPQ